MRPRYLSQSYSWSALGQLPEHRRAITGRTQSSAFYAADYDPIARYPGTPGRIRGWLLAVAIGLGLALASVHWWTT